MKKILTLVISILILALIYSRINIQDLFNVFSECRPGWLLLALGMVIPTTLLTSWRLKILSPSSISMRLRDAVGLTLSGSVLNMVLPSKMGDLVKACFIRDRDERCTSLAVPLVIFEKACDVLALLVWCTLGLVLLPKDNWVFWPLTIGICCVLLFGLLLLGWKSFAGWFFKLAKTLSPELLKKIIATLEDAWDQMYGYFWKRKRKLAGIVSVSLAIWFLHLLQIWLFMVALRQSCGFISSLGLTSLSIFVGLIPVTLAGIGTRDAALIFFYSACMSKEAAAAVGLLCTCRYIMPAIGGLPVFARYLNKSARRAPCEPD